MDETGKMAAAIAYIVERILKGERKLEAIKREACIRLGLKGQIRNSAIAEKFPKAKHTEEIAALLKRKPMRTLSGVAPIAVMVRPRGSCRWGCIYCPYTGKAPKSYTGGEPAALRAKDNSFDPFKQVKARLMQFEINGHKTEKCDAIIMGGTFLSMPAEYRKNFVKRIYDALNGKRSKDVESAKAMNATARHRMVGLAIETRPDVCGKEEIGEMLGYGATKCELGVQNPSDVIYRKINRGHTVGDVAEATQLLKDSSFKVAYHLMPGLPGSSPKKDMEMLGKIFSDERFRPDMLKIYPTLVIPGTRLHEMTLEKKYVPYSSEKAAEIIAKAYRHIPKYVRVMRIQRDIPANLISEGVKKSNLREIVEKKAESLGIEINEIRYREAGLNFSKIEEPHLCRLEYSASGGTEIFLSIEDRRSGALAGFLRLRISGEKDGENAERNRINMDAVRKEIDENTALIRELHVYGEEMALGERKEESKGGIQHRGFGSQLLSEAEKISKEELDKNKVLAISGAGVKPYYYKRGYVPEGPYVSKKI